MSQASWVRGHSNFWVELMVTKKLLFCFGFLAIKDASENRFWEYKCLGNATSREQYRALYRIAIDKNDTLAQVLSLPHLKYLLDEICLTLVLCHGAI